MLLQLLRGFRWVARLIDGMQQRAERSPFFRRFSILALAPGVISLFSVKGCATVVWLAGLPKYQAVWVTLAGFTIVCTVVFLSTLGVLRMLLLRVR